MLWKREVYQWRTDIMLSCDGREYVIGREEAPMTRGEAKRLARGWIARNVEILSPLDPKCGKKPD